MFLHELSTSNPAVKLVSPNVERDAALGVTWIAGPEGRRTLKLMGVADSENQPSSLEAETARVQGFLDAHDQYNWMINYGGRIIGTVWADLEPASHIKAPAVSIMLGDPQARGGGLGTAALAAVVAELQSRGHRTVYARHLTGNRASAAMLNKLGFQPHGAPYTDADGLHWQNCLTTV